MKYLLIIAVMFSVSGCFYQTINKADLIKAEGLCANKSGIMMLYSTWYGKEFAECMNGENIEVWPK